MREINLTINSVFSADFNEDTILYLVITYYDKNGNPLSIFPWRGFAAYVPFPLLLSDIATVGMIFAQTKEEMNELYSMKKVFGDIPEEQFIETLELIKLRMKKPLS